MVSTTFLLVAAFVGWALGVVMTGFALWLGLHTAKISPVSTGRIVLATLLMEFLKVGISLVLLQFVSRDPLRGILVLAVWLAAIVISSCIVISKVFHANWSRSFLTWLVTLVPIPVLLVLSIFFIRPFVAEAFAIPTNAMAPTILGVHREGVCPKCGAPNYYSVAPDYFDPEQPMSMICSNFHAIEAMGEDTEVFRGDRVLVAKFLKPKRWDLIVFRYPEDPSLNFVKRLVGLPGETIVIKDGKVCADGKVLTPPPELKGIEYVTKMPHDDWGPPLWGSEQRPAVLGEGEYFMLGDFSISSKDSRLWEKKVDGHPPYAVPEENLIGVVTQIYWPLTRYRSFR